MYRAAAADAVRQPEAAPDTFPWANEQSGCLLGGAAPPTSAIATNLRHIKDRVGPMADTDRDERHSLIPT